MIGMRYDSDVPKVTSPGHVVLLPYIKGNAESWCCGYGWTNKHTRERDFLHDGTDIFVFSPKHLRMMCFSDQFVIEL